MKKFFNISMALVVLSFTSAAMAYTKPECKNQSSVSITADTNGSSATSGNTHTTKASKGRK